MLSSVASNARVFQLLEHDSENPMTWTARLEFYPNPNAG
jgi:hypothetical protein